MYSQSSCNFLPDRRQSPLSNSLNHSFGLLRNFNRSTTITTRSFSNFKEVSSHTSCGWTSCEERAGRFHNFTSKPPSVMSIVYTLGETSRFRPKTDAHSSANGKSRSHDCRDLFAHYSNITALPFVSSHLVGGFVGSKSQLGRRPKQGLEVKMWDIIRDLLYLVGRPNPPNTVPVNKNVPVLPKLAVGKKSPDNSKISNKQCSQIKTESSPESVLGNCITTERKLKQSYADVARSKSGSNSKSFSSDTLANKIDNFGKNNSSNDSISNSNLLEPKTVSNKYVEDFDSSRDRITSECSADSEDSFIVFENCEEDHLNCYEDVNNWNDEDDREEDDDSALSVDYVSRPKEHLSHGDDASSRTSCSTESVTSPVKKVRFPEGKSLAKVHPMVTWNYAYRSARRGPWEMLARDSERFRCRIAHTETILKPVLSTEHRESVYRQRFAS